MKEKKIGAGILMIDASTGKVLLQRRCLKGDYPNTWSMFGGTYDKEDGHPKETAKREFEEETKIDIPYKISTIPIHAYSDNNITFYSYLGLIDSQFPVEIDEESLGYGWFSIDELPENLIPAFKETLDETLPVIKKAIKKNLKEPQ